MLAAGKVNVGLAAYRRVCHSVTCIADCHNTGISITFTIMIKSKRSKQVNLYSTYV